MSDCYLLIAEGSMQIAQQGYGYLWLSGINTELKTAAP